MNTRWQLSCGFVNDSPRGREPALGIDRLRSMESQNGIDSPGDAAACILNEYCVATESQGATTQAAPAAERR